MTEQAGSQHPPSPWGAPGGQPQQPAAAQPAATPPSDLPPSRYGPSGPPPYPPPPYPSPAYPPAYPPGYPGRPPATATPMMEMPERIDPVPGTAFGLAYAQLPPITSGQAVGSLVVGIASIIVTLIESVFGLAGASHGWGAEVAGAFGILAVLFGGAAIGMGVVSMRAIKRSQGAMRGHGIGRSGMILGIIGVSLAVISFLLSLLGTLAS